MVTVLIHILFLAMQHAPYMMLDPAAIMHKCGNLCGHFLSVVGLLVDSVLRMVIDRSGDKFIPVRVKSCHQV